MTKRDNVYLPTLSETILLPIFSFLFFAIANMPATYRRFLSPEELVVSESYLNRFTTYLNNDIINNIGLFIFWAVVGLLSYTILICSLYIIQAFRSEIPFKHYSAFHPEAQSKVDAFIRLVLRSAALSMIMVWLLANLFVGLRYLNELFLSGIVDFKIQNLIIATVLTAINLFMGLFLLRLFMLRRHLPGE
jgi:hypothetical protein